MSFTELLSAVGNVASVIALVITVIGFLLTWGRIRRTVKQAIHRVAQQMAAADAGTVLRLVLQIREAGRQRDWRRAVDCCQEVRNVALSPSYNPCLLEEEKMALRDADETLRLVLQYIENWRLPAEAPQEDLPGEKRRTLDRLVTTLNGIKARLQNAALEV